MGLVEEEYRARWCKDCGGKHGALYTFIGMRAKAEKKERKAAEKEREERERSMPVPAAPAAGCASEDPRCSDCGKVVQAHTWRDGWTLALWEGDCETCYFRCAFRWHGNSCTHDRLLLLLLLPTDV